MALGCEDPPGEPSLGGVDAMAVVVGGAADVFIGREPFLGLASCSSRNSQSS